MTVHVPLSNSQHRTNNDDRLPSLTFPCALCAYFVHMHCVHATGAAAAELKKNSAGADDADYSSSTTLFMVPRYDKETKRWSPSSPEEEASAGYPPSGSLLRQGPVPFFQRLRDPDGYDQGVLKMLANENFASRDEAQGNMDAYLQNPNDYALQKLEEKRTGVKYDYANANMSAGDLALTAAWTGVLLSVLARVAYVAQNGCDEFCQTYHW